MPVGSVRRGGVAGRGRRRLRRRVGEVVQADEALDVGQLLVEVGQAIAGVLVPGLASQAENLILQEFALALKENE